MFGPVCHKGDGGRPYWMGPSDRPRMRPMGGVKDGVPHRELGWFGPSDHPRVDRRRRRPRDPTSFGRPRSGNRPRRGGRHYCRSNTALGMTESMVTRSVDRPRRRRSRRTRVLGRRRRRRDFRPMGDHMGCVGDVPHVRSDCRRRRRPRCGGRDRPVGEMGMPKYEGLLGEGV